jgi:hypothetical protein
LAIGTNIRIGSVIDNESIISVKPLDTFIRKTVIGIIEYLFELTHYYLVSTSRVSPPQPKPARWDSFSSLTTFDDIIFGN